jgi:hypothetical protein
MGLFHCGGTSTSSISPTYNEYRSRHRAFEWKPSNILLQRCSSDRQDIVAVWQAMTSKNREDSPPEDVLLSNSNSRLRECPNGIAHNKSRLAPRPTRFVETTPH